MSDEIPGTGSTVLDLIAFAVVTSVSIFVGLIGFQVIEDLRRKDDNEGKEVER